MLAFDLHASASIGQDSLTNQSVCVFVYSNEILWLSDYLDPLTKEWVNIRPYFFQDGSNNPPVLLRTTPEQNYLDKGVRAAGLSLASVALLVIVISAIWVFLHHSHSVVIAAQPPFLYVLCVGSILTTTVIFIDSFDEGSGWDDAMLDRVCIAIPWLLSLGHIVTYSALFTKVSSTMDSQ